MYRIARDLSIPLRLIAVSLLAVGLVAWVGCGPAPEPEMTEAEPAEEFPPQLPG